MKLEYRIKLCEKKSWETLILRRVNFDFDSFVNFLMKMKKKLLLYLQFQEAARFEFLDEKDAQMDFPFFGRWSKPCKNNFECMGKNAIKQFLANIHEVRFYRIDVWWNEDKTLAKKI